MITLATLAIGAGSFLVEKFSDYYIQMKLDTIFVSVEEFELELRNVINKSLEEYELRYNTSDSNGKYAFYKSQIVINELLRYRIISDDYNFNDLIKVIENDNRIIKPTIEQINYFFQVFEQNVLENKKLRKLEIKENFQEEIYKISNKIDEIKSYVKEAISEINTALSSEWQNQLNLYQSLVESFKPQTALLMLNGIEDRFNSAVNKPTDKIYSKLYYLKALCFDLLKEFQNAQIEYIKAFQKDTTNVDYKKKAAYSNFKLEQLLEAKQLAEEIKREQVYDVVANFILIINEDYDESIRLINELPNFIKNDFKFKKLTFTYFSEKTLENFESTVTKYLDFVISSYSVANFTELNYNNFYDVLFKIEFAYNSLIKKHALDYNNLHSKDLDEIKFIYKSTRFVLDKINNSEVVNLYPQINYLYHYTDFIINGKNETLLEMKKSFIEGNIKDPNYCLILANCFQLKNQIDNAIEVVDSLDKKYEELVFFKAFCYYKQQDKRYFECFEEYFNLVCLLKTYHIYRLFDYLLNSKIANQIERINLESILSKRFESELHKVIINNSVELFKIEKSFSVEAFSYIQSNYTKLDIPILSFCALSFLLINDFESAISTYNLFLDKNAESHDLINYIRALFNSKQHNKELLSLLKHWRLNYKANIELLIIEINLRNSLSEWGEIIDIADRLRVFRPYDEDFYTLHLNALNQLSRLEEITELVPVIFTIPVKKEINALNIFNVFFLNGFYYEAFEFIYPFAKDKQNIKIRTHYVTGTINFPEHDKFFIQYVTVTEGLFVKYELVGKFEIVEIKNGSKNLLANELIGANAGDVVKIKRPMTDVFDDVKVIRIMNKYLALFEDIINQAENPHSGLPIQNFKFNDMSPKGINEFFIKNFGSSGSERKKYLDESFQQYIRNRMSFSIFTINCADNDYFKSYFFLANKEKGFLTCPIGLQNPQIDFSKNYVIDFTSLIALFDIGQKLEMIFDKKFIIPNTLFDWIEMDYKNEVKQPISKMSIDITSDGVRPIFLPENYKENQLKFYESLIKWIYEHCEVVVVESKLDYLRNNPDENENLSYEMANILDILYLLQQTDNILICDDQLFYNPIPPNICSTEMFLKSKFENIEAINSFFLMKGYIGLTLNKETLLNEFCKKRDGIENSYVECLKNIEFTINYSPVYIVNQVVSFLKEIYAENIFCADINTDTKELFKYTINGFKEIKTFYYLQLAIQDAFQSISDKTEQVLRNLNETLEQEYGNIGESGM